MWVGAAGSVRQCPLKAEYSALLAQAMLRQRARLTEHAARTEAQPASQITSEFMAHMRRVPRTPRDTLVSLADLLSEHQRRCLGDGQIVAYAERIGEAAAHLPCLTNDVRDISRMQSSRFARDAREVDSDALLQGAVALLQPMALKVGVALAGDCNGNLPALTGDAGKLRRSALHGARRHRPRRFARNDGGGAAGIGAHAPLGDTLRRELALPRRTRRDKLQQR